MYLLGQLKSKQIYLTNRLFLIKSEKAAHFEINVKSFLKKRQLFYEKLRIFLRFACGSGSLQQPALKAVHEASG